MGTESRFYSGIWIDVLKDLESSFNLQKYSDEQESNQRLQIIHANRLHCSR